MVSVAVTGDPPVGAWPNRARVRDSLWAGPARGSWECPVGVSRRAAALRTPGRSAVCSPYAEQMACPSCGAFVADGARFCSSCGQPLVNLSDERRVATVLFADLVGFTTLSETADPEQVKNLVDSCFERLVRDVTSFGGRVDKIVGDAIIALFGAPVAHEDDAERAVRAALRMQETPGRGPGRGPHGRRGPHRRQHRRGAGRRAAGGRRLHRHGRRGEHRPAAAGGRRSRRGGGRPGHLRRHP